MTSALRLSHQFWYFQDDSKLSTSQIFSRIATGDLDQSVLCRSKDLYDWQTVGQRFRTIGRYGLLKKLGAGGFGSVYLAFDTRREPKEAMESLLAIKCPTPQLLDFYAEKAHFKAEESLAPEKLKERARAWASFEIGQMFSKEAVMTARLATCPYVVSVIDHDIKHPFIALQYCDGGSLSSRAMQPYTVADVCEWGQSISKALASAHSLTPHPLIHRDLKPDNVLFHRGQVKVSDFGISKMVSETKSLLSGGGGGTPYYMAPEAFDGKAYRGTDIWALGVILYELIAGKRPFKTSEGGILALANLIIKNKPTPLGELNRLSASKTLIEFIHRCLSTEAEDRPSAAECAEILESCLHEKENGTLTCVLDGSARLTKASTPLEQEAIEDREPNLDSARVQQDRQKSGRVQTPVQDPSDLVKAPDVEPAMTPKSETLASPSKSKVAVIGLLLGVIVTVIALFQSLDTKEAENPHSAQQTQEATLSEPEIQAILARRELWQKSSLTALKQVSDYVQKKLGQEFDFLNLREYSCHGRSHRIAAYRHRSSGIVFHLIPGGSFMMGSKKGRVEQPEHEVTLRRPFLIGRSEVSRVQWAKLRGSDSSTLKGANLPITRVSWASVTTVLDENSSPFRLPTEAEWEYACRAGSSSEYYWENLEIKEYCWFKDNCLEVKASEKGARSINVHWESRKWNSFGLVDMSGNVAEWCQDWFLEGYKGGPNDEQVRAINPTGRRVLRGGHWYSHEDYCRSAYRFWLGPNDSEDCFGFRVVIDIP